MNGGSEGIDGDRDPFAALGAAVGACTAVDVVGLTDGEVLDAVLGLAVVVGQVEACLARVSASVRSRSLHVLERARSAESWLAAHTELSHGRAKALAGIGRQLPACPHVEAAYGSGTLGTAKVELLVGVRDGVEVLFAEHEECWSSRWRRSRCARRRCCWRTGGRSRWPRSARMTATIRAPMKR